MHRFLISSLLSLSLVAAHAQEPEAGELPEIRRYTVEVIIFSYAQDVGTGSEVFVPEQIVIEEIPLIEKLPPIVEPVVEDESVEDRSVDGYVSDIVILGDEEYTLGDTLEKLERLDVYEPVMHFAWQQSTWPEHEREALLLDRFGLPPEGLEGSLTLYLSRYLHLVVDLKMDEPQPEIEEPEEPVWSYGDYRTLNGFEDPSQPGPVRWHIDENRIFRSGELRYFDHPKFGVLAKVTRVEEDPEEQLDDDGETELLGYPAE